MLLKDNWSEIVYKNKEDEKFILEKNFEDNSLNCYQVVDNYLHFKQSVRDIETFVFFLMDNPNISILKVS